MAIAGIATPEPALSKGEILRLRLRMTGSEGAYNDKGGRKTPDLKQRIGLFNQTGPEIQSGINILAQLLQENVKQAGARSETTNRRLC